MLLIPCPWCGERYEGEFHCAGEAVSPRPADPHVLTDAEWVAYIGHRRNVRGVHEERWWHVHGCGLWFTLRRDTVTHAIVEG